MIEHSENKYPIPHNGANHAYLFDNIPDTFLNLFFTIHSDTLGVLARTIGKKNFLPLAEDCLQLGKNLIENEDDDPDMRRSAYVNSLSQIGAGCPGHKIDLIDFLFKDTTNLVLKHT